MSLPEIVVINTNNNFLPLTVDSIKNNMPNTPFKIVTPKAHNKRVPAVLQEIENTSICISSGAVVNIQEGDLPPVEKMEKYHMLTSPRAVFWDHKIYRDHYQFCESQISTNQVDMGIFVINPRKFKEIPESDSGWLSKISSRKMPRYMNHRDDPLVDLVMNPRHALKYGIAGTTACVLNYMTHYYSGSCSVVESWAYAFDKIYPHSSNMDIKYRYNIEKLAEKTDRIKRLRDRYSAI